MRTVGVPFPGPAGATQATAVPYKLRLAEAPMVVEVRRLPPDAVAWSTVVQPGLEYWIEGRSDSRRPIRRQMVDQSPTLPLSSIARTRRP
jgi:hypothetical protein